jgi:Holliday junction DNA helicase RuvA
VATLRRKVTKFALMPGPTSAGVTAPAAPVVDGNVLEDAYEALLSVGHGPAEARSRLDKALAGGQTYRTVEDILLAIYKQGN